MEILAWVALVCTALAVLRYLVGIPPLWRFARRARVRTIPKGQTPPLSLYIGLRGDVPELETNVVASLRQNYPEFEAHFFATPWDQPLASIARRAADLVPDVKVHIMEDLTPPRYPARVVLHPALRPDPLFLRDAANGLAEAKAVTFVPVLFGTRTLAARLQALLVNTDDLLSFVRARGGIVAFAALATRTEQIGSDVVLARRPARLHAPGMVRIPRRAVRFTPRLTFLTSLAPILLLAAAAWTDRSREALAALGLLTSLRALVAVAVDLAFCRDGSLLRSLPWLPLLWIGEPVARLVARSRNRRLATLMEL